jgi:hypothetical protein|tara:strand:- start:49 stop:672 length:624 start_codon:yes stop_codon:yes gene_type:complete
MNTSTVNDDMINITLRKENDNNLSPKNQKSINYIIELNKTLVTQNQKLQRDLGYIKSQIENKEEELEDKDDELARTEKSNEKFKGILKNFAEETKNWKEVADNQKIISDDNFKALKEFKSDIKYFKYILAAIYGICLSTIYMIHPLYLFCLMIIYTSVPIGIIEYYILKFNLPYHKVQEKLIKNKLNEIKNIEEGLGYIYEFIDNGI